jgi:uncharacterized membrane protein
VPPDSLPNLEHNTFWDGMFHVGTWAVTVAGVLVLASSDGARKDPGGTRTLIGGMLAGWGGFNLVEGLIDHHVLALHHVRPGPDQLLYDLGFLLVGAGLLFTGIALVRSARSGRSRNVQVKETQPAQREPAARHRRQGAQEAAPPCGNLL